MLRIIMVELMMIGAKWGNFIVEIVSPLDCVFWAFAWTWLHQAKLVIVAFDRSNQFKSHLKDIAFSGGDWGNLLGHIRMQWSILPCTIKCNTWHVQYIQWSRLHLHFNQEMTRVLWQHNKQKNICTSICCFKLQQQVLKLFPSMWTQHS